MKRPFFWLAFFALNIIFDIALEPLSVTDSEAFVLVIVCVAAAIFLALAMLSCVLKDAMKREKSREAAEHPEGAEQVVEVKKA